jgi:hypothetical protein
VPRREEATQAGHAGCRVGQAAARRAGCRAMAVCRATGHRRELAALGGHELPRRPRRAMGGHEPACRGYPRAGGRIRTPSGQGYASHAVGEGERGSAGAVGEDEQRRGSLVGGTHPQAAAAHPPPPPPPPPRLGFGEGARWAAGGPGGRAHAGLSIRPRGARSRGEEGVWAGQEGLGRGWDFSFLSIFLFFSLYFVSISSDSISSSSSIPQMRRIHNKKIHQSREECTLA